MPYCVTCRHWFPRRVTRCPDCAAPVTDEHPTDPPVRRPRGPAPLPRESVLEVVVYRILLFAVAVYLIPHEMIRRLRRLTGRDSEEDRRYRAFEQRLASRVGKEADQVGPEEVRVVDEQD